VWCCKAVGASLAAWGNGEVSPEPIFGLSVENGLRYS